MFSSLYSKCLPQEFSNVILWSCESLWKWFVRHLARILVIYDTFQNAALWMCTKDKATKTIWKIKTSLDKEVNIACADKSVFWHFENWRTIYSYFDFSLKNSSFRLPYQHPSSSADCARELFMGSNGSASPVDCTRKKIFWLGVRIFCEWRHKWSSFGVILPHVAWTRAQPLGQSVSLKFSLETRLESESWAFDRLSSISGSKVMI